MAKTFRLYLKNGETITFEIHGFKREGERFVLYSRYDTEMGHAYISHDDVSALVPAEFRVTEHSFIFRVYLREHKQPIVISASAYKIDDSNNVEFYFDDFSYNKVKIDNLFILFSDVVAIIPETVDG